METNFQINTTDLSHHFFPSAAGLPQVPIQTKPWLLELESDGTIRYSSFYPYSVESNKPVVGSNFFELQNVGDLSTLKHDFTGFVKGDKNRQTFHLGQSNGTQEPAALVILTRSYDSTENGSSCVVVLMELKKI